MSMRDRAQQLLQDWEGELLDDDGPAEISFLRRGSRQDTRLPLACEPGSEQFVPAQTVTHATDIFPFAYSRLQQSLFPGLQ